jgi:hypothetical protein
MLLRFETILALITIVLGLACEKELTRDEERALLDAQKQEIISLAKSGACAINSQCRYTGLGSKPCGGPWGYIVYSTSVDTSKLFLKISDYNAAEDRYNRKWGIYSTCDVPPPPDSIRCLNGVCVGYRNGMIVY